MKKVYPGYPPNYLSVKSTSGYSRDCMVIDVLSLAPLEPAELAVLEEQISALLSNLTVKMPNLHKCELITSGRFDRILMDGLRLR